MSRACGSGGSEQTTVPQNLLLGRRVSSCAWSASLLKQRHCKHTRSDTLQDRSPSSEPCRFRAASHQCRSIRCFGLRVHLQELGRLIRPPPAQRASFPRQLRVSAFHPLASSRYWKLTSRRCTSFGCAIPSQGTNESRVDRKLCVSKEGQPVRQDFQKACVPHIESGHIEISNRHVRRDASSCFPLRRRTPTRRSVSQARQPLRT